MLVQKVWSQAQILFLTNTPWDSVGQFGLGTGFRGTCNWAVLAHLEKGENLLFSGPSTISREIQKILSDSYL